jgi:subtilisin family serine protease
MSHGTRIRGRTLLAGALALGFLLTLPAGRLAAADPRAAYAPGEVLVGFRKDSGQKDRDAAIARAKGRLVKRLATELDLDMGESGVHRIATDLSVEDAIDLLRKDPNVEFAEPNWLVTHSDVSDDTYYANGSLWGMYGDDLPSAVGPAGTTNAFGCEAEKAWDAGQTGSSDVCVGIVDEGMQITHPELAANVWTNPFDPVDGIDNDGNGYVDDVHGWDFWNGDNSVYDAGGDAHGTHVAGTIGATGGNGAGVAGVNWNVTLISAKFLGPNGGYISDAVSALNYLRDLKVRHGLRIVATNNSWGGGGYSSSLHTAILKAAKEGILFVAAAGNSGSNNDSTASYPSNYSTLTGSVTEPAASYEAVIAVAAIDSSGAKASWSSYGATTVDIGAPGVSVLSTVPTNSYAYYSGTSMATPHVTGAVALYASAFPAATAAEVRSALLGNAKPTPSLSGITVTGGRLSLAGLFGDASSPPQPPAEVHDVAVTGISMPGSVKRGKTVTVNVAVANQGTTSETFQVSLSATGGTVGPAKSVTLAAGASTSVPISWTAPNSRATFTITATAATVSGETDTADNTRSTTTNVR